MDGKQFQTPALILFLLFAETAAIGQWSQTSGPLGGRISAMSSNPVGLFVGTDNGSVYVLTSLGGCWQAFNTGLTKIRLRSFASDASFIYAGNDSGVFRSATGIASWTDVTPPGADTVVSSLAMIGDTVFAAIVNRGLYRSPDKGLSWFHVNSGLSDTRVTELVLSGDFAFAGTDSGVFVSIDRGFSWTPTSLLDRVNCLAQKDSLLFAGTRRGDLFLSTNYGTSWNEADSGLYATIISDLLVIDDNMFAATDSGVFYSTNRGGFWQPLRFGLSVLSVVALASFSGDLYAGTEGGMSIFGDGNTWTPKNCGLIATTVRALAILDSTLFAGTIGSGMFTSMTSGATWNQIPASSGLKSNHIISLFRSEDKIFAGTIDAGVFVTSNGGVTWAVASNGLQIQSPVFAFAGGGSALYAAMTGGVFLSTNAGQFWTRFSGGVIDTAYSLISTLNYLFVGTADTGVYRTPHDSTRWEYFSSGLTDSTIRSFAVKGNNLFAGGFRDDVFRSPIDTAQWERLNNGLPDTSANDLLRSGTDLFAATPLGVFLFPDTGETWISWNEGLTATNALTFTQDAEALYAGTLGGGVWTRSLPPSAPQLVSPEDNEVDQPIPITLTWSASERASGYDLQISPNSSFTVLATCDSTIVGTSRQIDGLAKNTQYYWRVRSRGVGGTSSYSLSRSFRTSSIQTFTNEIVQPFPETDPKPDDYRLVSFPGTSTFSVGQLFQGTMGTDWRIFKDNGSTPPNHLTELSAESTIVNGEGYWCLTRGALTFSQTVAMPALDTAGVFAVDIDPGWNILGNPFDRPLYRDAIRLANLDPSLEFYSYAGGTNFPDSITLLQPFKGYYFNNSLGLNSLRLPYPFPCQVPPSSPTAKIDWMIRIALETSAGTDSSISLGVSPTSLAGRDQLDKWMPPPFFEAPRLVFLRPEWDSRYSVFKSDFRPPFKEGGVWLFEVHDASRSAGTLRIMGTEEVPQNFEIFLVNLADSTTADFRAIHEYHYVASNKKNLFKLLIGTSDFVENEATETLPVEFHLSQNFPNPFNPSTTIRYAVSHEAMVAIEIWSALGQRLVVLTNEWHLPGFYVREWMGLNSHGIQVSSGVYFYRMLIDDKPFQTRKMLLIR